MRITGVFLVVLHLLVTAAWGDHTASGEAQCASSSRADWDAWYDGEVQVRLRVEGGEGAVFAPDASVRISFEATESAYHLVYAVDTRGQVHLLFPRFWEDDGWVGQGRSVKLRPRDFASRQNPWGDGGIVYVEAVASPTPFDWQTIGLRQSRRSCRWMEDGRPLRISGDPFLAFNEIHRGLFPRWNHALFTVDYTWFYIGSRCDAPTYLGYDYARIVVSASPRFGVRGRFHWDWDFGAWCARPVYRSYYVPGKHRVPRRESHVVYTARYQRSYEAPARQKYRSRVRNAAVVPKEPVSRNRTGRVDKKYVDNKHRDKKNDKRVVVSQDDSRVRHKRR